MSKKKLVVLSKSQFCYTSELYTNKSDKITFNTFSNQFRTEVINKTKIGKLAQSRLNKGLEITKEISKDLWRSILGLTLEGKVNFVQLNITLNKSVLFEILNEKKYENIFNLKYINLELDELEFKRRCSLTLNKGKILDIETFNSFIKKYWQGEINRRKEIRNCQENFNIQFQVFNGKAYEYNILHEIDKEY